MIYSSGRPPHPRFKANFRVFDARDFIAHVVAFIPDPFRHESIAYGEYANVVRGRRRRTGEEGPPEIILPPLRRIRRAWSDLIRRVYEVDPLVCDRCGSRMRIVAFVTERAVIERILACLGLWPPPIRPPRPRARLPAPAPPVRAPAPDRNAGPDDDSQVPQWWDETDAASQLDPRSEE